LQSKFRIETAFQSADFADMAARTPGISQTVKRLTDSKKTVAEFCFTDMGGQMEFYVQHELFMGGEATVFLITSPFTDEDGPRDLVDVAATFKFWLQFIKACSTSADQTVPPAVILVATHPPSTGGEHSLVECDRRSGRLTCPGLESFVQSCKQLYAGHLDIQHLVVVDARVSHQSVDMVFLRDELVRLHDVSTTGALKVPVPVICADVIKYLPDIRTKFGNAWTVPWKDLAWQIRHILKLPPIYTDEKLLLVTDYLHEMGEIVFVKRACRAHEPYVVLQTGWLFENVLGYLLAPPNFKKNVGAIPDTGILTRKHADLTFPKSVPYQLAFDIMEHLQLARRIGTVGAVDEGVLIPSLLRTARAATQYWCRPCDARTVVRQYYSVDVVYRDACRCVQINACVCCTQYMVLPVGVRWPCALLCGRDGCLQSRLLPAHPSLPDPGLQPWAEGETCVCCEGACSACKRVQIIFHST
jgi:hypothetical protein